MLAKIIREQNKDVNDAMRTVAIVERSALKESSHSLENKLIKVIVGPRRAGKSIFAWQLLQGKKFAYLNFDDENLLTFIDKHGTADLEDELRSFYGKFKYIFFDEIQNLERWELMVNRLQRKGYNLVITGSNAKLLSSELATHLTGRYQEITILPFSWEEYKICRPEHNFDRYLESGGFPEIATSQINVRNYLDNLSQAIILKDIVKRHKVRQVSALSELYNFLNSNATRLFSLETLLGIGGISSKNTVKNFIRYFKEAWLLLELKKFSPKQKEQLKAQRKIYPIDNGFINESLLVLEAVSRKLETQVLIDILRQGIDPDSQVYYYRTKNDKEIDFIIKRKVAVELLIQVSLQIDNPKTKAREISALQEAARELQCSRMIVVTLDNNFLNNQVEAIEVVPITGLNGWLKDFLR